MSEPRCEYCQETQHSWHACVPLVAALRARAEAAEQKYTELQNEWDKAREAYEDARATNAIVLRDLLAGQARLEALGPVLAAARVVLVDAETAAAWYEARRSGGQHVARPPALPKHIAEDIIRTLKPALEGAGKEPP